MAKNILSYLPQIRSCIQKELLQLQILYGADQGSDLPCRK